MMPNVQLTDDLHLPAVSISNNSKNRHDFEYATRLLFDVNVAAAVPLRSWDFLPIFAHLQT